MAAPDETTLLSVASSIADGSHVDWARLKDQRDDEITSSVLTELALVEQIAGFHRGSGPFGGRIDEHEASADPQTWGHFRILERIGRGAFGAVYRAEDVTLQSEVALKLLPVSAIHEAGRSHRLKEARLLARVRHPNVVSVYGADYIDGCVGIWMELIKGRTLASLLNERGPLSAREAALLGLDLCRALAAVHHVGLLHGDVKAHNVMRERGGRTVLMDFGTGKDLTSPHEREHELGWDFAGTPLYLAPEVFEGRPRTKHADIYSLGVLLYHLVTDAYPADGRTRAEIEEVHRRRERKYLRDVRPDLPVEFIAIVERALAIDPRERYQSTGAFEAELARFSGQKVDLVPRPRRRWIAIAALAAATVVLAAAVVHWTVGRSSLTGSSRETAAHEPADRVTSPSAAASAGLESTYQIDTALYRVHAGGDERLRPGMRVIPGDNLFAKVRVSVPTYVYIVNEDDQGETYLLFPLPGQSVTNPLPAETTSRIPGSAGGVQLNWQITSAGGREHFLIFASPERLPAFERMFAALPQPTVGKSIQNAPLSHEAALQLRSVGGLVATPGRANAPLSEQYQLPLGDREETARGLWVRQFTVDNPIKDR